MKHAILILTMIAFPFVRAAEGDALTQLSLGEIEIQALENSYSKKALNAEYDSVKNKIDSQNSLRYPKITLEGNYKYISEVPTLNFPGGAKTAFGDNTNYSIGPVMNWTLWDFGSIKNSIKGSESLLKSKEAEKSFSNRQILLNARLAYFRVQLRIEQQKMVTDSLKLAESQHRDIQNRLSAGLSNRIDLLSAHKEVLNLKIQSRQIQSDLSTDLRDLYALIGKNDSFDPKLQVKVDPLESSLYSLSKYGTTGLEQENLNQHPLIKMYTANAEASRLSAESFKANKLPKLALFAKSSIDYPNGPILENIHQNAIGLTLSMPLFESSKSSNEALEKQNLAIASENRREEARTNLVRDWQKANDQLQGLKEKVLIFKTSVDESAERAKLVYSSYRVGRSSFLEVQSANLHALEAKVQSTTNNVQILIQLAYLASIAEEQ
ncbi:MAG: TolC family protein [Bacteriovoracaceae bacterium]|nr:TolC family protein [Bacteriovoracaceae bacterium]